MLLLSSIRCAGTASNSGTPQGRKETPLLRLCWKGKVVMVFGHASRRDSACIELTVVTSQRGHPGSHAGIQKTLSLSEVEATARGHYRCPLGKLQGSSAADPGNPYPCSRSQSLPPACKKWLLPLRILQCHGNVLAKSCLSSFSEPVADARVWWQIPSVPHCSASGLCGGNSVSGCPCLSGHCVNLFVWLSRFGVVLTLLRQTCARTFICTHTHLHIRYLIRLRFLKNYKGK